jgi:methionyl-tRNA formyltransferase
MQKWRISVKVIFMGTPDFSVGALEAIIEAGHEVVAVVTQPDKKKGRGNQVQFPPVKEIAIKHNLPVYQPAKVKDEEFVKILGELGPDIIVVSAFGQILPKSILDMAKYGCINIHASLLPKYRGAAPIQWSIIDGEEKTGVTIMQMDEGLDTGDILEVEEVKIEDKETGGSLFDKLSEIGAKLVVKTMEHIEAGQVIPVKQDNEKSNYAKMLTKELGNIDFNMSAVDIERLIRGLTPWPSAYTKLNGKTLKIWDADVIDKEYEGIVGEIVDVDKQAIYVKTGKNTLAINELQLEGKKRMDTKSFLLGFKLEKGVVLG